MALERIAVLGLGSVGHLAAELLQEAGLGVIGLDRCGLQAAGFESRIVDAGDVPRLREELSQVDGVLSCLPHNLNPGVAEIAHDYGIHYFDLTEDVSATRRIMGLARTARAVMAPQCGLAPGLVCIVASHLEASLDTCRSLRLRAGALPRNPSGLLGYAFNWSPTGVINEYLNDCEVLEDGVRKWVSPMEWHETVYVNGTRLEAFTTSGGLGTMCDSYQDRVENLDYKTLRYPGHVDLMNFFFHELLMRERRDLAQEILLHAKPPVTDDVVHVYVAAEGTKDGRCERREFVRSYQPRRLCGARRTAIAWTTAASVTALIELVRHGRLIDRGFLRQESVPFELLTETRTGELFLGCSD